MDRSRSDSPRLRTGRSEAGATARSSRRRTAGGEQAAAMRYGCRRGRNLRRVERQRGHRTRPEKLRLRRPTRGKPGEPRPGTGCNMPGAVNGGSRRGGEKPRGRSETDGVAAVGRRKIPRDSPGVDVHGDIGRWDHSKGRSSKRGRSRAPRGERIRLGPAGTPEARPRWGGGVTGIREDLGARPGIRDREATAGDSEWQDGSVRKANDGRVHRG
jgi:hypothetical protein